MGGTTRKAGQGTLATSKGVPWTARYVAQNPATRSIVQKEANDPTTYAVGTSTDRRLLRQAARFGAIRRAIW